MTLDGETPVLIVLNAPPSLEDHVLDWLVSRPEGTGFTSMRVAGHGADPKELSIAEQVAGRQQRVRFEVLIASAKADEFLAEAAEALGTAAIRYWVVPVLAAGHLGD